MIYATKEFTWLRPRLNDEVQWQGHMEHVVRGTFTTAEYLRDVNHGLRLLKVMRRRHAVRTHTAFTNNYETFVWLSPKVFGPGVHYISSRAAYSRNELQALRCMWMVKVAGRQVA